MDNDLISKHELKGKISHCLWKYQHNHRDSIKVIADISNEILDIIENVETVEQPQGEWIPVSERLPEQNGYYITTCRDICENRVHTVGFDGVRKKWGRGGVIAWQPLPEPYKQD